MLRALAFSSNAPIAAARMMLVVTLLGALALAGACGSDDSDEPEIPGELQAVLAAGAAAMGEVDTARFEIERTGEVVHIDNEGLLGFDEATGRFEAPSSSDAVISATANGVPIEVGAVAIEGMTWLTNPVTGRWEVAPEALRYDPATMFDPEIGWRPLLATGLSDAKLVGTEPEDDRYEVHGIADGERVAILTGGLVEQSVPIELWLDADSGRVIEAQFDADTPTGPSTWRLSLSDYGSEVVVERPELSTGS